MPLSVFIFPLILIFLLIYSKKQKVNAYSAFLKGAKTSLNLTVDIFPFLIAIFVAVNLFRVSGLAEILGNLLAPVFEFLGIPPELSNLVLIRPFSGSASLAITEEIYDKFGADSYISRCASTIMGSSETVFYIATIYFSQTKAKKLLYAIPVSLFCTILGAIISCFLCKII
ncbi:MAG: spore maturation protein [Clostridia bacterium]|nr:spore maturation protein [Clostridia bacterium]